MKNRVIGEILVTYREQFRQASAVRLQFYPISITTLNERSS